MAEKKRGCLGWAVLTVLTVAFAFVGGQLLFMGLEVLALAFTRLGITDPTLAWGLTGAVLGALVGLVVGLHRAGRKRQFPEVALAVALVIGLAFLGARAAGDHVRATPLPSPSQPSPSQLSLPSSVLFEVVVTADALNVRPAPSTANDPLTTVERGQRLGVVAVEADWYAVRFERDGQRYEGWISSAYTTRTDAPSEEVAPEETAPEEDAGPRAGEATRTVSLGPSAPATLRLSEGRLYVQVLLGSAETAPGTAETRVTLRVEERSFNVVGAWPAWAEVARRSYLTDGRGGRNRASAAESVGPGGEVLPGRVRQGTLVFYVPLPPEAAAAMTLVYASGDARPVDLPLGG